MSLIFSRERGPFDIFLRLRNHWTNEGWLAHGIRCAYCISVWVGLSLAALLALAGRLPWQYVLFYGLAFSGATIMLDKFWGERR